MIHRSSGSRFASRPVEIIVVDEDEYFDIDDDRMSNFKDVGEDTEFDVVENVLWGWVKSYHRRTCTYNYKDLKERLPRTFDDLLNMSFVRKVFQHCLRFMSGYRQNLEGPLLDYAMRKYTSHRVVPIVVAEELSKEYETYLKIKTEKTKK